MNIVETILSRGEAPAAALLCGDRALTYLELRQRVACMAAGLLARGHAKGDRIGLWSENSPFFVTGYLGIIRAGLVAVPFQTEVKEATFERIVRRAGIKEVLASARFMGRLAPWAAKADVALLCELETRTWPDDATARMPKCEASHDLAALMFTSGSTGDPKGVMVTHRNIERNTADIVDYMGLTSADRVMVVLPLHYCFGASLLHTHLMVGGSVVLNNMLMYPEAVIHDMRQKDCTGFAGVPSTFQILLRSSRFRETAFPRLRWFQQAGGKLPNPHIMEILNAFPRTRFFLMYGQTEATARLSYLPPERLADKLGSIGKGLPSTHLNVLKPDGSPVKPGSDQTGEIVATGENITRGYWKDPVETAKYFKSGRLYTGDIARVDADGFIYIVDRVRDLIKTGGNRVSAKEVEDIIAELPEVVEVAVLGSPHDVLGESIEAFVVVAHHARIAPDNILAHCLKRLPRFKVPECVWFVQRMPHNGSGKILKPKLRELDRTALPGASYK